MTPRPWQARRFGGRPQKARILLGRTYEDSAIERRAFSADGRIFCIASSGSMAMALGDRHDVVACDLNPVQLAYAGRRLAGGPIERGVTDRSLAMVRRLMPLVGWCQGELRAFLALSRVDEQVDVWRTTLDTWRFRTGFDAALSLAGLRSVYAPALLDVLPPHFGAVLRSRMLRCFSRHPNASNPYARELFLGDAEPGPMGTANARRVQLVHAEAASYLEGCPPGSFTGFSLSNILDGARPAYRERLTNAVRRAAAAEAIVVARSYAEPAVDLPTNHAAEDRSMVWGRVEVVAAAAWSAA